MKIAIFGRLTERTDWQVLEDFFGYAKAEGVEYRIHDVYARELVQQFPAARKWTDPFLFHNKDGMRECDFAFSFGGDGTLLNTVIQIEDTEIPLLGVNFGRLGFLTSVTMKGLKDALGDLLKDQYRVDARNAMVVESRPRGIFGEKNFGLNDLTIHKSLTNEMITVHTYINGEFLNSYWGDGLIIATPTGSTAYSLSCGGPIIHPRANAFVITPVAPHSLTVRPVIIPDNYVISFEIESRAGEAMVAMDTRTEKVSAKTEIAIRKADFKVNLVRINPNNYLNNLRTRLHWGRDTRN